MTNAKCLVEKLGDELERTYRHVNALEPSGGDYEDGGLDGQGANSPDLPANGGNKKRANGLGRPAFSALFAIATPMLFLVSFKICCRNHRQGNG